MPRKNDGRKIILFLGRITFQKGPDYFVEAAARVLEACPEAEFVMAGAGDMRPRMVERAAELGIGRSFHFPGFLSRDRDRRDLCHERRLRNAQRLRTVRYFTAGSNVV